MGGRRGHQSAGGAALMTVDSAQGKGGRCTPSAGRGNCCHLLVTPMLGKCFLFLNSLQNNLFEMLNEA